MSPTGEFANMLDSAIRYFNISAGTIVFSLGLFGNIFDIIILMSLKTFRKSPCALFLLLLSISDSGILIFNTLPSVFVNLFKDYGNINTVFSCKIAISLAQIFGLVSQIIICFAAFDRYTSTSIRRNYKTMTHRRILQLIFVGSFISILYGVPYFIFYESQPLPGTNSTICRPTDNDGIFSKFITYFGLPIIDVFIPLFIMSWCGLMAFFNVRAMSKRQVHVIRLRSERQLTALVLMKILCTFVTLVPFLFVYVIRFIVSWRTNDLIIQKQFQLVNRIFTLLFFANYGMTFYVFVASSARFRRQLKFVLFEIYLKRWRERRHMNRIQPVELSFALRITMSDENREQDGTITINNFSIT